ncbi:MAG: hypothetical protein U0457_03390 [Candidatus Sericytochromatia bacterium]
MYKCQFCKETIAANIKSHKVVVQYRNKKYPLREKAFRGSDGKWKADEGGKGYEIVEEKTACYDCYKEKNTNN